MYDGERETEKEKSNRFRQTDRRTDRMEMNKCVRTVLLRKEKRIFFLHGATKACYGRPVLLSCTCVCVCGEGGDNPLISQFRIKIMKKEKISRRMRINGRRGRF